MKLARYISRVILGMRQLAGLPSEITVKRNGVSWQLDLEEGIDLALYLGVFERSTTKTYRRIVKRGGTVIDIGANIGAHALPAACLVGKEGLVVAIEPTRFAFEKLLRNISLNPEIANTVCARQQFVSTVSGSGVPASLFSSWQLTSEDGVHQDHGGTAKETRGATVCTLDQLAEELELKRIDLIKVDVDGFEYDVLSGAGQSISKYRPAIVIEIAPYVLEPHDVSPVQITALLEPYGYRFYAERDHTEIHDPEAYFDSLPFGSGVNLLALPQ